MKIEIHSSTVFGRKKDDPELFWWVLLDKKNKPICQSRKYKSKYSINNFMMRFAYELKIPVEDKT